MKHKPVYYRWAWSPTTGDVTLSHNDESPPIHRYHHVMADERPEKDVQVGYASRLADGWKVMDQDWDEVDEPALIHEVVHAIVSHEKDKSV